MVAIKNWIQLGNIGSKSSKKGYEPSKTFKNDEFRPIPTMLSQLDLKVLGITAFEVCGVSTIDFIDGMLVQRFSKTGARDFATIHNIIINYDHYKLESSHVRLSSQKG